MVRDRIESFTENVFEIFELMERHMPRTDRREKLVQAEELILRGHFKRAAEIIETLPEADDLRTAAVRAQLLIYQGRLDEAAEVLELFEEAIQDESNLKDVAEFEMAKAEWLYWRGEYEAAEKHIHNVLGIYRIRGDEFGQARALCLLGRLHRRQGNYELAKRDLEEALDIVERQTQVEERDFLVGTIRFNLGVVYHQLGELERAESLYKEAMQLLKRTENGRYYGFVLNSYGMLLRAKGEYERAARCYQEAITYFSESASFDDLAHATNNLAYVEIQLGHLDKAEELLNESLELRRRANDIAGESVTLELMGILHLKRGRLDEARRVLQSAIELADLAKSPPEKAFALITLGRVLVAQGAIDEARQKLDQALRLAIQLSSRMLECESCIYLAEIYARKGDGARAYEYLERAQRLMERASDAHLRAEMERVERLLEEEKIKTSGGVFMIRSSFLPTWREAHEALGKFLLAEALNRTGGSQVKAAKLLGVTKAYITMLRRKYHV